ncbi:MAG: formylglycine-generating enzyme family protein [Anaerolineae bacterium]|jgi:formylglycine-generating enzyme required for sulfatase activity
MIHIPAGAFLMGTSDEQVDRLARTDEVAKRWKAQGRFTREQPHHTVTLASYSIGRYPVTVGEYGAFVRSGGYHCGRYWTDAGWAWRESVARVQPDFWDDQAWAGDDRLPVVGVSWYEAVAYCRWLSEETGTGYRLPTEAEWEKAARGTDGQMYPWGDEFDFRWCNTRASELNRTVPVGSYSPHGESPYGCAEMAGNASEWTLSRYNPYPYNGSDGRNNVEGEAERVIRGGSWYKPVLRARVAARGMNDPFFADNDVGFRCVCEPVNPHAPFWVTVAALSSRSPSPGSSLSCPAEIARQPPRSRHADEGGQRLHHPLHRRGQPVIVRMERYRE